MSHIRRNPSRPTSVNKKQKRRMIIGLMIIVIILLSITMGIVFVSVSTP